MKKFIKRLEQIPKKSAQTITRLMQSCVRRRNNLNKSETIRMKKRAYLPRVHPCPTFAYIVKLEG